MKFKNNYLYILFCIVFLSCNENTKEISSLGKAGEIRIIASEKTFQKNSLAILEKKLVQPQTYLAQSEPYFIIDTISISQIDENSLAFSQILIVKFKGEKFNLGGLDFHKNLHDTDIKLSIHRNIWAFPQVVYLLEAGSEKALDLYFKKNAHELFLNFLNSEKNIYKKVILADVSDTISQFVQKEFKMDLLLPNGFHLTKYFNNDSHQFAWIRREKSNLTQGVIIYKEPFKDSSQFNLKDIISRRDSVLKKHIPGPIQNTYMETELQFPIAQNKIKINDVNVTEIRGMWKVKNDLMGGPFYSITFIKDEMIYTIEGFLYAPRSEKTPYLRELEAIVNSLQLD